MSEKISAITIGPIYDTMQLVTKPAGLWGASYLFSYIAEKLTDRIKTGQIITPKFDFDENEEALRFHKKGIGFYHDHILIRDGDLGEITDAIKKTKKEIGYEIFCDIQRKVQDVNEQDVVDYVEQYLQIFAVETEQEEGKNAIEATGVLLDAIELEKSFVNEEARNYIALFLENDIICDSFLQRNLDQWMLKRNNGLMSLEKIALSDTSSDMPREERLKRYSYYAMVSSDGDRMGKIIENLKTDDDIRDFSNDCMEYTTAACRHILDFDGLIVYAGGDDLQFMAPLTHGTEEGEKTVFDLLDEIIKEFNTVFRGDKYAKLMEKPTVSFGVAITYVKYPLYETLGQSYGLLHTAKDKGRDRAMIRLQKHSGQTAEVCIKGLQENYSKMNSLMKPLLKYQMDAEALHSVIMHLSESRAACEIALEKADDTILRNYLNNNFDNPGQVQWEDYLDKLESFMKYTSVFLDEEKHEENETEEQYAVRSKTGSLILMLRIIHMFGEKGKEEFDEQDIED